MSLEEELKQFKVVCRGTNETNASCCLHFKDTDIQCPLKKRMLKLLCVRTKKILVLLDSFPYAQTAGQMESWIRRIKREVLAELTTQSSEVRK